MLRGKRTWLFAGLIGLGVAALLATGKTSVVQSQTTGVQPYTVNLLWISKDLVKPREVFRQQILFAKNSRGSTVEVRQPERPGEPGSRIIVNVDLGQRIVTDPPTESVTTYRISNALTRQRDEESCAHTEEKQEIFGISVYKKLATFSQARGRRTTIERWIAPSLGCQSLSETVTHFQDEKVTSRETKDVLSVQLGEPSAELFNVPSSYVERAPSEVMREAARRHPERREQCPQCDSPTALGQRDAVYYRSKK